MDPDTTHNPLATLLINVFWDVVYRWAMKDVERLRNEKIKLGR